MSDARSTRGLAARTRSATRFARATTLVLALAAAPALAHTLDTGTARVSLRDAHLEVLGEWDVFAASDTTPTALAIASPDEAAAAHGRLQRALEDGSHIEVDGRALRLAVTGFPSVDELRAVAATLSAKGLDHGALVRVRLEARDPLLRAERVHVRFPPELGPVLVTFVQPSTVFAPPGAVARFGVLAPRAAAREPEPTSPAWALGGATAVVLAGLQYILQQRKRS